MARGIHGRAFRPGTRTRRFDPRYLIRVYKQVGQPDDPFGEPVDPESGFLQELYAHRRVQGGGSGGSDANPTSVTRVEFVTGPSIKIPIPYEERSFGMGESAMGGQAMGDQPIQGQPHRIEGPQVEPGYIVREPSGKRYVVRSVSELPDKRVAISCELQKS